MDRQHIKIAIEGMTCASCVGRVERTLTDVNGVRDVSVNLASETAQLDIAKGVDINRVAKSLEGIGYLLRTQTVKLTLTSLSCASCIGHVDRALGALPGVLDVNVNLTSESATVTIVEGVVTPQDLLSAARAAGYPAELEETGGGLSAAARKEEDARLFAHKTLIAALLALPVFLIEMGSHVIPGVHDLITGTIGQEASWYLQFALTTIILIGPGRVFYALGFPSLLRGAPDMNSLVAVGTAAAYLFSVTATFAPGLLPDGTVNVYYEAAAVSGSDVGKSALASMARLDLEQNPGKYLQTRLVLNNQRQVSIQVFNQSPVPVTDVEVVAAYFDQFGKQVSGQKRYRLRGTLASGQQGVIGTGITNGNGLRSAVVSARIAQ